MANEIAKARQVFGIQIPTTGGMLHNKLFRAGAESTAIFQFTAVTFDASTTAGLYGLGDIAWDASANEVAIIGACNVNRIDLRDAKTHAGIIKVTGIQVWTDAAITGATVCTVKLMRRVGTSSKYPLALPTGETCTATLYDGLDFSTTSTAYHIMNLSGTIDLESAAVGHTTTNATMKNIDTLMLAGDLLAFETNGAAIPGAASKNIFVQVNFTKLTDGGTFTGVGNRALIDPRQ